VRSLLDFHLGLLLAGLVLIPLTCPLIEAVFLAPKVQLAIQQGRYLERETGLSVLTITGPTKTKENRQLVVDHKFDILVCTPRILVQYFDSSELHITHFYAMIFDECHHAVGEHDYATLLTQHYTPEINKGGSPPRLLGLTASPAAKATFQKTLDSLDQLLAAFKATIIQPKLWLQIVKAQPVADWVNVEAPSYVDQSLVSSVENLIKVGAEALKELNGGEEVVELGSATALGQAFSKLANIHETASQQSNIISFMKFLLRIWEVGDICGADVAIREFKQTSPNDLGCQSSTLQAAYEKDKVSLSQLPQAESVRFKTLITYLIKFNPNRAIIFVKTRFAARLLCEQLNDKIRHLHPEYIVGRSKGELTDEQIHESLARFRSGETKVLVATSVLEEGIDIPECDMVIRLTETLGDFRSFIQARGRARSESLNRHARNLCLGLKIRFTLNNVCYL